MARRISKKEKIIALVALPLPLVLFIIAVTVQTWTTDEDAACAFVRAQIRDQGMTMGNYRGTHPCTGTARGPDGTIWDLVGTYRSGLRQDIQPSVPFTATIVWDNEAESFAACTIAYRPGGVDGEELVTIEGTPAAEPCAAAQP